jgi:hypothetical protein
MIDLQYESNFIFPKDLYIKFRAPNAEEFIDALEKNPQMVKNDQFEWGKLYSSPDKVPLENDEWQKYLIPSLNKFSEITKLNFGWKVINCWLNLYKKGDYQEIHNHDGIFNEIAVNLSCVFFVNNGENFSDFYFFDVNHSHINHLWTEIYRSSTVFKLHAEAGDILFFPTHLFHNVSPHKSDIIRKTFSANIMVTEIKPMEPQ